MTNRLAREMKIIQINVCIMQEIIKNVCTKQRDESEFLNEIKKENFIFSIFIT